MVMLKHKRKKIGERKKDESITKPTEMLDWYDRFKINESLVLVAS